MSGRENQRVKLTKTLLKNSLIDLMHSKPINKITIKELCENADINRSTFYLYYSDQYALLGEIEKDLLLHAEEHMDKISSDTSSVRYLQELLTYIKNNKDIFRTLLCRQENFNFQTNFIAYSMKKLKITINLKCSEKISEYVFHFLTMGCLNIIKEWIISDFDISVEDMAHMIFRLSDGAAATYK